MNWPAAKRPTLPLAREGELYGNVGRYAGQLVLTAFEMIGGEEAFADWAAKNPTEFYTKVFTKVIARPVQIEATASKGMEDLIRALDAKTIEGTVVRDEPDGS